MGSRGDSWIIVVVRVVVAAVAAACAVWNAATVSGLFAAVGGAVAGVVAGEVLGRSGARLTLVVAIAAAVGGLALWGGFTGGAAVRGLGPEAMVSMTDGLLLAGLTAAVVMVLRATATRYRLAFAFELALLAIALAAPLAAHRGGAINRPLELGDYAWSQGEDPVIYLQLAGGVSALALALFLIREQRWLRALLAALLVLMLSLAAGVVASVVRPLPERANQGLGLTGRAVEEGQRGGQGDRRRSLDQLDFRDNYRNKRQNAPVAVVLLRDDYDPPVGAYYFRQKAFSQFNGRRLVPATAVAADQDVLDYFPAARSSPTWVPPEGVRREVRTTVALLQDHVNPVVLEAAQWVAPARNPSPRRFLRVYDASSLSLVPSPMDLLDLAVGDDVWTDAVRQLYVEGPEDPRYAALAQEIVGALPEELRELPVAQAAMVTAHLSERGTYSTRSRHAGATDPAASFLFGDLTGYCVHFAHAAVYLFRALGIPSRLATGYQYPATERGRGSSLLLRSGDAHAWPEVFITGVGWTVFDVSPARNNEAPAMPVDPDLQRMLGEMLRGQLQEQRRAALEVGRPAAAVFKLFEWVQWGARGALWGLAALLVALIVGKWYRRLVPLVVPPAWRTRASYRCALDRLSEVGQRRRRGEAPELFARRMAQLTPSLAPLADAASARRLGSSQTDDPTRSLRLAREVARELRRAVPWWRRGWAWLNPFAWPRVR
jgi:transglutaminase-like putative cysteine protease